MLNVDKSPNPFFVAEISANHLGSLGRARNLVKAAAEAGANAIKFQTYTAETMTLNIESEGFSISKDHPLWGGRKLFDLYDEAHTPWEWHKELFELCMHLGAIPFSSPFDLTAVDFLENLNTPMYKISSMETSDLELISKVSNTGKPTIISTGATFLEEIDEAVECFLKTGNRNLTLLVCTSAYPANPKDANLARIGFLKERYGLPVGLSDHTLGLGTSLAAIALGATVIEKHFIISRNDGGPDAQFSMEPTEFKQLVIEGQQAHLSIGSAEWHLAEGEKESRRIRRSLYVSERVKAGEKLSKKNVRAIRPGFGMSPKHLNSLVGKKFKVDCEPGTPVSGGLLEG